MQVTDILQVIKPYVLGWIETGGGGEGGYAPSPHELNGAHHIGTLSSSQYPDALLRDGSRSLTGNLSVGAGITVDGVDISVWKSDYDSHVLNANAHHNAVTLDANADAVLSLSTQQIGLDTQAANRIFAGPTSGAAAVPTFRALVAADIPALGGTPALTFTTSNAAGSAATYIRTDASLAIFDATVPTTIQPDDAAAAGSAAYAARRDHKHAIVCAAPTVVLGTAAVEGSSTSFLRADCTIVAFDATVPTTIQPDDAAAAGSAAFAARRDHKHAIVAEAPSANITVASTSNTEGSSTSFARADHGHAITTSDNPGANARILASNASGYLQLVRLGIATAPSYPLHVIGEARIDGDLTFVGAQSITTTADNLTLAPAGDITLDPTGNDVLPYTNYDINLGHLAKKYLTLHCAELWVETLVAQDTIATIGGRILVGPTTVLTSDLAAGDTTIYVKHNQMVSGDRVYLEADGKVEFMAITSAPGGAGPYSYSVTRNLDGTGANVWYAGDAVFNTGAAGDGFIDLYSIRGVKSAAQYGPTIVGNVRNSATYNDWTEAWAIGNLNGLYGYGVDTYGVGLGKYSAADYVTIDPTNGIRFLDAADVVQAQLNSSVWTLGRVAASYSNVAITSGALQLRTNTTVNAELTTAGELILGDDGGAQDWISISSANGIRLYGNNTLLGQWTTAGAVIVGEVGASKSNVNITSGALQLRTNTTVNAELTTAGELILGDDGGAQDWISISSANGIRLYGNNTLLGQWTTAGAVIVGEVANSKSRVEVNAGALNLITRSGAGADATNISLSAAGVILIGQAAASQNNVQISSGAISIRNNTTERVGITAAGVLTIKNSSGNAVFTFDSSAGAEFTLPLTLAATGGIYQGSGSFASPTTGLKMWNDGGVGRIAGYNSSTIQWYGSTDGRMYAGTGKVRLDASGVTLERGSSVYNKITWTTSSFATTQATIYNFLTGTTSELVLSCLGGSGGFGGVRIATGDGDVAGTDSFFYNGGVALGSDSAENYITSIAAGSSTKLTCGLVINQRDNDNEIMALQSSDVAHGMTDLADTNTYGTLAKAVAASGGINIAGYTESEIAAQITARGTTDNTTKLTTASGYIVLTAHKKSGTTTGDCGADANLVVIRNRLTARFIFDAEGSAHADVEWTTFDAHDDVAILRKLESTMLAQSFGGFVDEQRNELEQLGIAHFDERPGHAMVNWTRLSMLQTGAIRQLYARIAAQERQIDELTRALTA